MHHLNFCPRSISAEPDDKFPLLLQGLLRQTFILKNSVFGCILNLKLENVKCKVQRKGFTFSCICIYRNILFGYLNIVLTKNFWFLQFFFTCLFFRENQVVTTPSTWLQDLFKNGLLIMKMTGHRIKSFVSFRQSLLQMFLL